MIANDYTLGNDPSILFVKCQDSARSLETAANDYPLGPHLRGGGYFRHLRTTIPVTAFPLTILLATITRASP